MSTPYHIKLEKFEGPLDLLLHLIKIEEIDIYDIPIAHITLQYLSYIELMEMLDLDVAGEFLVMAATLMRIKARMLLPASPVEEEEAQGDPREELVRRLLEYKRFKEAAQTLREREDQRRHVFERGFSEIASENGEVLLEESTLFDLMGALRQALARVSEAPVHEVETEKLDVVRKIAEISQLLKAKGRVRFSELLEQCETRLEIIGTFISILELVRTGRAGAVQRLLFGDIWIYSLEGGEARGEGEPAGETRSLEEGESPAEEEPLEEGEPH
ncbi:MAG: segregation/condensation protein A [Candidatus Eisenbacteria bacterium]|nr:segregation/condensation protein A [Candidatus Eisenbacteria bacterium]